MRMYSQSRQTIDADPERAQRRILNVAFDAKNIGRATRFYAFSFHPGLRRMSDYHKYLRPVQAFFQEDYINTWLFWHGFYMVWTTTYFLT